MYRMRYNLHRVSIHATLAGGDDTGMTIAFHARGFYPRHPRGWRRPGPASRWRSSWFLSTPPSRVATKQRPAAGPGQLVSIHATLAGGDRCTLTMTGCWQKSFYPRHPRGWRPTQKPTVPQFLYNVSIHATLAGGDGRAMGYCSRQVRFYPRHPRGWRRNWDFSTR